MTEASQIEQEKPDAIAQHRPTPTTALSPSTRRRLTHLLVAKSMLEVLFVAGLAVGLHYVFFNPYFRGWTEMNGRQVSGWAIREDEPYRRVEVQLYIDDHFAGSQIATGARPDVVRAGRARDEWNGFNFDIPTTLARGEHEARVYVVHESGGGVRRTLQQLGHPLRFRVDESDGEKTSTVAPGGEEKP
ncbi:MAG TPA: hypothetical protein VF666_05375 [Pyrinomonadaceae bacterium]|jgi:hypothetical protein